MPACPSAALDRVQPSPATAVLDGGHVQAEAEHDGGGKRCIANGHVRFSFGLGGQRLGRWRRFCASPCRQTLFIYPKHNGSIHVHPRIFTAEYLRKFDNGFRNMDCLRPAGAASMPANDPLPVAEPATANAVRRARSTAAIEPQGLCGAMGCRCRIGPPGIGRGPGSALEQALTAGLELGLAVSETSIRLLDARLGNALGPDAPDAAGAGRIQPHRCPTPPDRHRLPGAGDPSWSRGRANTDEAEGCVQEEENLWRAYVPALHRGGWALRGSAAGDGRRCHAAGGLHSRFESWPWD